MGGLFQKLITNCDRVAAAGTCPSTQVPASTPGSSSANANESPVQASPSRHQPVSPLFNNAGAGYAVKEELSSSVTIEQVDSSTIDDPDDMSDRGARLAKRSTHGTSQAFSMMGSRCSPTSSSTSARHSTGSRRAMGSMRESSMKRGKAEGRELSHLLDRIRLLHENGEPFTVCGHLIVVIRISQ